MGNTSGSGGGTGSRPGGGSAPLRPTLGTRPDMTSDHAMRNGGASVSLPTSLRNTLREGAGSGTRSSHTTATPFQASSAGTRLERRALRNPLAIHRRSVNIRYETNKDAGNVGVISATFDAHCGVTARIAVASRVCLSGNAPQRCPLRSVIAATDMIFCSSSQAFESGTKTKLEQQVPMRVLQHAARTSAQLVILLEVLDPPSTARSNESVDGYAGAVEVAVRAVGLFCNVVGGERPQLEVKQNVLLADGREYEVEEVYGLGSASSSSTAPVRERDGNDLGGVEGQQEGQEQPADVDYDQQCVVCLSAPRDTMVLPCRHLCVCCDCALRMRTITRSCPICRQPIDSMLQLASFATN
mmetsp:Transcript_6115/g.13045  ORF Transcript_6115/g.13045 Transcript_6115/m.13045 type:complete len:356 (+) Transcript_6115:375-1442(+)